MSTFADKASENRSHTVANSGSQLQSGAHSKYLFVDNRPAAIAQRKLQETINNSPRVQQLNAYQDMADGSPRSQQVQTLQARMAAGTVGQLVEEEELLQGKFATAQLVGLEEEEEPLQGKFESLATAQREQKPNNTGMPDNLKSGIENLSGLSMADVKVHYNSPQPAQLNALAYARGHNIHITPGQERHLPHEAWHVVQQAQGRVQPTMQMKHGVPVNDDAGLEREADVMGAKALAGAARDYRQEASPNPMPTTLVHPARLTDVFSPAPFQLYTRVPVAKQREGNWNAGVDLRVADDGQMAVPEDHAHRMFATNDIITEASMVMLGTGSMYRLHAGNVNLHGRAPNAPEQVRTLVEAIPQNLQKQKEGNEMTTTEACSTLGQEIMGAAITQGPHPQTFGLAAHVGGATRKWDRTKGGDNEIVASVRNQMSELGEGDKEASEIAYEKLPKWQRNKHARKLGVNQYANPSPGEGLAVYSAVERLRRGYPMHFAAVIARSAGDYVTLENYAKESVGERNLRAAGDTASESHAWYFKMYGPTKLLDDQSFYGEHVKIGEQGGIKGTMVLRHKKEQGFANAPIVAAEARFLMWERYASTHMDRDRTPLFKKAYEEFLAVFRQVKQDAMAAWLEGRALPDQRYDALSTRLVECQRTEIGERLYRDPDWTMAPKYEMGVAQQLWSDLTAHHGVEATPQTREIFHDLVHERAFDSTNEFARTIRSRAQFDSAMAPLPESEHWRIFIDHRRQAEGKMAFDNDAEPGYFAAMTAALSHVRDTLGVPLSLEYYVDLHRRTVEGVVHRIGRQDDAGTPLKGGMSTGDTHYGMQSAPSANAVAELEEEKVMYMQGSNKSKEDRKQFASAYIHTGLMAHGVYTNYPNLEVAALHLSRIMTRYTKEIGEANSPESKLSAIVRVVRALQVGHFFQDANRRAAEFLVLNKLLIEHGFSPAIIDEDSVFDGRKSIAEILESVEKGQKNFSQPLL